MFRLAVKSVRHNPKRLILTAIAVALGVSLVAATFTLTSSLSSGFAQLFREIYASTDVIVEPDPNAEVGDDEPFSSGDIVFSADDVAKVAAIDGVEVAAGGVQVPAVILNSNGDQTSGGNQNQIFNWFGDPRIDQSTIIEGHAPEADDEIVLDVDSAKRLDYAVGDTVQLATQSGVERLTLVGLVRFGEDNQLRGATLAFVTDAKAHEIVGEEGYAQISVITAEGANNDKVAAEISKVIPDGTRAISGEAKAEEQIDQIGTVTTYINVFALVFALIALFVGAYIIVNTFRIIVTQRTRELGLLRAIGGTGRQIRAMILLEAAIVAVVASTLGIGIGYLLALGGAGLLKFVIGNVFGAMTLPWTAILWPYVLGVLVTVLAALAPAIHASRISPMEALREAGTASQKPLRLRNVVGAALFALGALSVAVGLYASLARPYIYVGVGAVLLILGLTLLSAQVLVPLAYGLRGVLAKLFGVDGKLAANNIRREPRRSANTAAALMIGVMLLALTSTFTESLKAVFTSQFSQMHAQLLVFSGQGAIPQGALDIVAKDSHVQLVSRIGADPVKYEGKDYTGLSLDSDSASATFEYNTEPDLKDVGDGVFIDPVIAALGVKVGDQVTLTGDEGTETLTVTGKYLSDDGSHFVMDWDTGEKLFGDVDVLQALVLLNDGADVDEAQASIEEALKDDFPLVMLQQPDELQQLINQVVDFFLGIISLLLLVALFIALLGVVNTLLLSITERTREIGLLRAVGVKKSSVWRMVTVESMVMALFGTVLGMALGVGLGSALVLSLGDLGFVGVSIPWVWLIVYTVLAAIAGVLAAVWPAWRASRLDILKAIAADG